MCGIAGIVDFRSAVVDETLLRAMTDALAHRGPDDEGVICRPGMGLGHRRLSILDLSPAGRQPMSNEDETVWIVFNGEAYNFEQVRPELEAAGHRFRSTSDTEVILHAYEEWGDGCMARFNGMWALAIWDEPRRRLFCARDRFGKKPFHYHLADGRFCFASEIKALLATPLLRRAVNPRTAARFLAFGQLDAGEETFFAGIRRLPAGHYAVFEDGRLTIAPYWQLDASRRDGPTDLQEAARGFRDLFDDAVRLRLISDVPVAATLSGGLDSSSVVVTAAELIREPHRGGQELATFSARFPGFVADEGEYIRAVEDRAAVRSHHRTVDIQGRIEEYENLLRCQDEPVISSAMLANYEVMRLVHEQGSKVVLEGQGADEYLAGYPGMEAGYHADLFRGLRWTSLWSELRAHVRLGNGSSPALLTAALKQAAPEKLRRAYRSRRNALPGYLGPALAEAHEPLEEPPVLSSRFRAELRNRITRHFLPFYLRYGDRNAMAFGIESRLPFLDYRLVEYTIALPDRFKISRATRKWILRQALRERLPAEIAARTDKIGFLTPQAAWMRGPLRERLTALLTASEYRSAAYLDRNQVVAIWNRFLEHDPTLDTKVFRFMIFELWLRLFDLG